uniref:Sulfate transport system permease protein CysT n=1 Tax=Gymnomitrion concinnatum TaxID=209793 RepID=A0A3G6XMV4_9MARC|nr:sulfate transport protein [Gymnomitrion concinnatum]AZB86880.1 sulfate transport protein [Gymnomitrion concinnatum]
MIQFFFITPFILFIITKGKIRFLAKFEILLSLALHYGIFILVLPISILLYITRQQSWDTLLRITTEPITLYVYSFTFLTALLATIINSLFGLILAWVLVRYEFPGKKILDATVDLPFALPTSVGGLTLMTVFSDKGWLKPIFSLLGIRIVFGPLGVLIAMIFVSLPFVVRTIQPVLQNMEKEPEEAAQCLGASSWTTFWHILFPPLIPSLLTGTTLGFSRALGEYGSIVLIASNIPMKDLVISVLLFQKLEQYDYRGAAIIASFVLIISFGTLFSINKIQSWKENFNE